MKVITIVGARPQFVKAATVSRAIEEHNIAHPEHSIEEIIVHTGQHYDSNMSDVFFVEMSIPRPKYSLGIGGGSHGAMTGRQLEQIEAVLIDEQPDRVLVYGDTNSTLAGALAAAKLHIPVLHVEAGLRSFNMEMPEEINRILTDQVSTTLYCPTDTAMQNLTNEGFAHKRCTYLNVGDVMYDAAMFYTKHSRPPTVVSDMNDFVLVTIHRADNTDSITHLSNIIAALNEINKTQTVVCPVHPRTKKLIADFALQPEFMLLEPVSYFEMLWLLQHCSVVITDSGGLQKEAYFFDKYCITMREQTEWVELIAAGMNELVGADKDKITTAFHRVIDKPVQGGNLYGDARAAHKIVAHLAGC